MAIVLNCPDCGATVSTTDEQAGRVVRCGQCMAIVAVPKPSPAIEPATDWQSISHPVRPATTEPEPPRRRRPPRQSSLRPLFWVLGGVMVVGVLVASSIAYLIRRTAEPNWDQHEPLGAGCQFELPAPQQDLLKGGAKKLPPGVQVYGTIHGGREYGVCWWEVAARLRAQKSDEQILNEVVAGILAEPPPARIISQQTLTVSGFPACDLVCDAPDLGIGTYRCVLAESRMFVVFASGTANDGMTARVLDSFQVVDPNLMPREKRREIEREFQLQAQRQQEQDRQRAAEEQKAAQQKAELNEEQDAREFLHLPYDGVAAPDPTGLPELKLYASCDGPGPKEKLKLFAGSTECAVPSGTVYGPGPRGKALYFPHNGAPLSIPFKFSIPSSPAQFNKPNMDYVGFQPTDGYTVAFWCKARLHYFSVLKAKGSYNESMTISAHPERLSWHIWNMHPHQRALVYERAIDTTWHHCAVVRSTVGQNEEVLAMYCDGEHVKEERHPTRSRLSLVQELQLGGGYSDQRVRVKAAGPIGALDEVCIFGRALEPEDIRYLAGRGMRPRP